jgi:hypothetical protein
MHKLSSLEAQRVTAVLDDTLESLNSLSYVPISPSPYEEEILQALTDAEMLNVKSCLQSLWQLEDNSARTRNANYNSFGKLIVVAVVRCVRDMKQ